MKHKAMNIKALKHLILINDLLNKILYYNYNIYLLY